MAMTDLFGIDGYPVPSQAQVMAVTASDGVAIRTARWRPTARRVLKGSVLVVQGRAEFIERYSETIQELRRRGFHVATFDWRGQGGSDRLVANPRKGHVRRFGDYQRDLDIVFAEVMARLPKPWFVLAHSMGSAICLEAALRNTLPVSRLVALAPMLSLSMVKRPAMVKATALFLDSLFLGKAFVPAGGETPLATRPFASNRLTGDPVRYARNAQLSALRPELAIGDPTIRWVREAYRFMDRMALPDVPLDIRVPTLVIAAGCDPVVSTPVIERFAARLKTGLAVVLPTSRHEILHETDDVRASFWAAFDAFVPGEAVVRPGEAAAGRTAGAASLHSPVEDGERGIMNTPVA